MQPTWFRLPEKPPRLWGSKKEGGKMRRLKIR
jgi:hypothetical protein